ncbi:unnamed protein product [Paramecium sonneborni]|uniref:Uncharacterized protein n=1 Tax=Paramecium sonneborni TaxID=65129 RepID=A0A8S1RWD4_9CILI|nr:unnamed protein product [Paramecium sonneborni]
MKIGRIKKQFYRSQFYFKINQKRKCYKISWKVFIYFFVISHKRETNKNKVDCNKNQWKCMLIVIYMKVNGLMILQMVVDYIDNGYLIRYKLGRARYEGGDWDNIFNQGMDKIQKQNQIQIYRNLINQCQKNEKSISFRLIIIIII